MGTDSGTVDLEIFTLGNFCTINFRDENFIETTPYHVNVNSAHVFS